MNRRRWLWWGGILLAVALAATAAGAAPLRILHINDFHGFAKPYTPYGATEPQGGAAYLAGDIKKLRRERPTLVLAAGDMIQGNNLANLFQGRSVIEILNAMGLDAMVVGNHEFDFGQQVLQARITEARFPVLGANVEGLPGLRPYVIESVGGLKVAVIGVVTPDTTTTAHPRNVAGLRFESPETTLQKYLPELKPRADLVVVLSHLGYERDRELAGHVAGIDVIVGGHSHTRLNEPVRVGETLIVQAWEHGKALGVLDLEVTGGKVTQADGRLEEIKPQPGRADLAVAALVAKYSRLVDRKLARPAGVAAVELDGQGVRRRETNLGNLVADIVRQTAGAQAALINGGGIRTSIKAGTIRMKDIYNVLPFDNYVVAVRLTGAQLRAALEHGVSAVEQNAGRFPQVSGLRFTYNPQAPAGSRIREVRVGTAPLDLQKEYTVATNDFLVAGGDGYAAFQEALGSEGGYRATGGLLSSAQLTYNAPGRWLRDIVVDYLRTARTVAPRVEGRITTTDK